MNPRQVVRGLALLAALLTALVTVACSGPRGDVGPVPPDVVRVMSQGGWEVFQVPADELSTWPSPDAARSAVRDLVGEGYDFSEVYACRIQLNTALPGQTPSTLGERAYAIWAQSPGRAGTDWLFFVDVSGVPKTPIMALQRRDLEGASATP